MSDAANYVTREEFEPVKLGLEKLTIRVEVLSNDLHQLTLQVGDIAEDLATFREEVSKRFDEVNGRFAELTDEMNRRFTGLEQTQSAILTAVLRLLPSDKRG